MVTRKGYKLTEVGEIPEDWDPIAIGPHIRIGSGSSPSTLAFKEIGIPYFKVEQLNSSGNVLKGTPYFIDFSAPLPANSIVFPKRGASILLNKIKVSTEPFYFDTNIMSFSICNDFDHMYIFYQLQKTELWRVADTTSIPQINNKHILPLALAVPRKKTEQTAIATALSDADALIEALEQSITKKRHIKQGAMQELLTGKKRLPGFEGEWKEKLFCELAYPSRVRFTPSKKNIHNFCIELEHIEQCTGCLLSHTETTPESSLKSKFESGDILFGKLRAYLRKYWLATRSGVCSTEFWVLKPIEPYVTPEYIHQLVQTDAFIEAASTAYGTHMPRSDWNVVRELEIKVPPLDEHGNPTEQTAIAAVLTDMDEEIAALEAKLTKAKLIKAGMMQELLTGRVRLV